MNYKELTPDESLQVEKAYQEAAEAYWRNLPPNLQKAIIDWTTEDLMGVGEYDVLEYLNVIGTLMGDAGQQEFILSKVDSLKS